MKKLILILSALLILIGISASQSKFNVNIYGGYTLPVADLKGSFPDTLGTALLDFNKSKTLLTTYGINFGIQGKYAVDSAGSQRVTGGFSYNTFSGSTDYSRPSGTVLTYKNKVNIFNISAGIEYALNPSKKFVPFAGLELAANFFSGKVEASGDTVLSITRKTETRFGVIANAGIDIKLWKSGGIIAGVKYALSNLIGKKSETTAITTLVPSIDIEEQGGSSGSQLPLNDETVSSSPGKVLNYVQFYLGISLNFGKKIGKKIE